MRADFLKRVLLACVFVLLPTLGYAQEATIGTITDATGAVLPGVTVVERSVFPGDAGELTHEHLTNG